MLRITMSKSASGAKQYYSDPYYSEGKSLDTYYSEKEHIMGTWGGKGAEKLGLTGDIDKEDFSNLCDNINPQTQEQLTARHNVDRRVGYDFTFDAGKSVSLAYAFGTDEEKHEIMAAFRDSVKESMTELEKSMQTRVRVLGQDSNRDTGNIAYGEFVHFTTRPVDGVPDPQLHAHCFTFNITHDQEEDKWKAGQFGEIKEYATYHEAMFHSILADKLQNIGYQVERNKNGFELKGVERETIEKFSRRTKQIEDFADKEGITSQKRKAAIGSITREAKQSNPDPEEVWQNWNSRLTEKERRAFSVLFDKSERQESQIKKTSKAIDAVQYSLDHHLERKSVSNEKEILTLAIKESIGEASHRDVQQALYSNKEVIWVGKDLTTKQALAEENSLIKTAFELKGKFKPINANYQFKNDTLTDEQKRAVSEALNTKDGILIISGKAGTGKTTLSTEINTGAKETGNRILPMAATNEAVDVLRKEGFTNAVTIAHYLLSKELQKEYAGAILQVDEGGLLSNKHANALFSRAKENNNRIIIIGDTAQHTSVERGDAMRVLQKYAGISTVWVTKVQRQQNKEYRNAAEAFSKGHTERAFKILDDMGAVHEYDDHNKRYDAVAEDYITSHDKGKNVLVVAPTHREGDSITAAIRDKLKLKDEHTHQTYQPLNLTMAEKSKIQNYEAGNFLIFHAGKDPGSVKEIEKTKGSVIHFRDGTTTTLDKARNFNVFSPHQKTVGKGEKIRLNGRVESMEGKQLFNGTLHEVKEHDHEGRIVLMNGATLPKNFGRFNHGYVSTSVGSQGKTVDKVIISQSAMSGRAANNTQTYVSMTRGRKEIAWYIDDKTDLLESASRSGNRISAIELREKVVQAKKRKRNIEMDEPKPKKDKDHGKAR